MEELNDVEFGSDKSTEEAPILVAQRYLNIFRQIHIFNKDKRNQFDDELLALPQNITDFFKRMPGGRLLVEHIEDVKTERGISFVKSNKEDFSDGDAPSETAGNNSVSSGGNVVMDASFAETLASSMAAAFKQAPMYSAANMDVSVLDGLNKTFQLIAEEIKASRNSFIEVLRETKQMTESVISSQVAMSRVLEKLCIEQQGSSAIRNTIDNLAAAQVQNSIAKQTPENNVSSAKPQQGDTSSSNVSPTPNFGENTKKKKKKKKHNSPQDLSNNDTRAFQSQSTEQTADITVKSEKIAPAFGGIIRNVTAKHNDDFANVKLDEPPFDVSVDEIKDVSLQILPQIETEQNTSNISIEDLKIPDIDAVSDNHFIQQEQFDDTLIDKQPNISPMDELDSLANKEDLSFALSEQSAAIEEPMQEIAPTGGLDSLVDSDGLEFALPEQSISAEEPIQEITQLGGLDSLVDSDGLEFALPEQSISAEEPIQEITQLGGLDSLADSDGLEFALPEQPISAEEPIQEITQFGGLDSLADSDGLEFALPEQSISAEEPIQEIAQFGGLDSLADSDGLEFALPEQTISAEEPTQEIVPTGGLDDLLNVDSLDFSLPEQNMPSEKTESAAPTSDALDSLINVDLDFDSTDEYISDMQPNSLDNVSADPVEEPLEEFNNMSSPATAEQRSRYSEELDKIRAALTTDNIDISSLDQPIALDDYSDDENVSDEDTDLSKSLVSSLDEPTPFAEETDSTEEEWEWEYVDEDGNPIENAGEEGEDWEWEYVEDDGIENTADNNNK